ncbi:MAG: hypothetical protein M1347_06800 [Chloroflexi bacterium]|nr:hypothetical protein [Chloroflexota bacterium]
MQFPQPKPNEVAYVDLQPPQIPIKHVVGLEPVPIEERDDPVPTQTPPSTSTPQPQPTSPPPTSPPT